MYSIIAAIGCISQQDDDGDLFNPECAILKVESDNDCLFEDVYAETRDLEDTFGIVLNNLNPGIYRIRFNLSRQDKEYSATDIRIAPVSWPDCETL